MVAKETSHWVLDKYCGTCTVRQVLPTKNRLAELRVAAGLSRPALASRLGLNLNKIASAEEIHK